MEREARATLLGRGDPAVVAELVRRRADAGDDRAGWMSIPRGTAVEADTVTALGLQPFSSWDWLSSTTVPRPPSWSVVLLDRGADAEAILDCLAEANPGTTADPTGAEEVAWWGLRGTEGRLDGVVGASLRGGVGPAGFSWHLHGLGVRPAVRGRGVGEALTAVATSAGLAAGASWVSLAMYADNDAARRIYHRLGYATDQAFDSYGPAGTTRPPA